MIHYVTVSPQKINSRKNVFTFTGISPSLSVFWETGVGYVDGGVGVKLGSLPPRPVLLPHLQLREIKSEKFAENLPRNLHPVFATHSFGPTANM
jgi:hypothetical protein